MPKVDKHATGTFCWFELGTTDQASAKSFYAALFGWSAMDYPMGPDAYYTMFMLPEGSAGAAYGLRPEESAVVPPHWNLYIAVENAEASAARAAELGGTVIEQPFDVMTFGKMAVLQDPTGAFFNIWEAREHAGTGVTGEKGTVAWADLSTPDPQRAKEFYQALFGWEIGPVPNYPAEYLLVEHGGHRMAGIQDSAVRNPNAPPHWMLFFTSDDVDGAASKAAEMGGRKLAAPMDVGPVRMAVLSDAQGAAFSVIQHKG